MEDSFGFIGSDDETDEMVRKYESMLLFNKVGFFDVEEFEWIIDYYRSNGYPKKALDAVELAFLQHPNSFEIKLKRAYVFHENGKDIEALRILTQIQKLESSNPEIFILKGSVYLAIKQYDQAKKSYDIGIKLEIDDKGSICYSVADNFAQNGHFKTALEYYHRVRLLDPEFMEVYFDLANVNQQLGEYELAEKYLQTFLDYDPFSVQAWYLLSVLYNGTDRLKDAVDAIDYGIAIDSADITLYFLKAGLLMDMELVEEALDVYDEITELDPKNAEALVGKGEAYENLSRFDDANWHYDMAINIDKEMPEAWYGKASVAFEQNNFEDAKRFIATAIDIFPSNPDYWYTQGKIAVKTNNQNLAIKSFVEASSLDPADMDIWITYAETLYHFGKTKKAIWILKDAMDFVGERPEMLIHISVLYFRNSDFKNGFSNLEHAISVGPTEDVLFFEVYPEGKNIPGIQDFIETVKLKNTN